MYEYAVKTDQGMEEIKSRLKNLIQAIEAIPEYENDHSPLLI
jgi:hypothetical protein